MIIVATKIKEGSFSKIKDLHNLQEKFENIENKKEVYFRLTQAGTEINNRHEAMHKKFLKHDEVVFEELSEQESEIILNFLEKYNHHLDKALRTTFKK